MKPAFEAVLIFGLSAIVPSCTSDHRREGPQEEGGVSRVKVELTAPREGQRIYKAPGTVRAATTAPLSSKIMGTVLEVRVRAGDRVKAGQVLAMIDARETEAMVKKSEAGMQEASMALQEIDKSLEAAQANLRLASSTLQRFQELANEKSISPQEFDEVRTRHQASAAAVEALQARKQQGLARIQQAQSDVSASQALRSYAELRSPIDGVVAQRQAEPGSLAIPGIPLLTVEDSGRYRLEVPVEEGQISRIRLGKSVPVRVDAISYPGMQGVVSEIQPSADPASRTYLVKVNLPPSSDLRSGMYGEAYFEVGASSRMWLPRQSIVREGQLEGVFVVDKSHVARLRLLKLGEVSPSAVEVLAGLDNGETVVVEGMKTLQDGSKVEVIR